MLTVEQKYALGKLRGCIKEAQKYVKKTFNSHHLDLLFFIAENEGVTRNEINAEFRESMSTTKKYVAELRQQGRKAEGSTRRLPGFDLIHEIADEHDNKVKHIYLNERGMHLCETLADRVLNQQSKL